MPEYTLPQARKAAAALELEIADLRVRDESGRFVAEPADPEPETPLEQAAAAMRLNQDAGLARLGLRTSSPMAPPAKPKSSGDFGGGNRGQPLAPARPSMNELLIAAAKHHRGY